MQIFYLYPYVYAYTYLSACFLFKVKTQAKHLIYIMLNDIFNERKGNEGQNKDTTNTVKTMTFFEPLSRLQETEFNFFFSLLKFESSSPR